MLNTQQLRGLIRETLQELSLEITYSEDAVELLMLTAAHESLMGTYIEQVKGPALGIFQMEPATEQDIYDNYLRYHPNLAHLVQGFKMRQTDIPDLKCNLAYQIAMARVHYYRVTKPLPSKTRPEQMAKYWKEHYNTVKGAGHWYDALQHYMELAFG